MSKNDNQLGRDLCNFRNDINNLANFLFSKRKERKQATSSRSKTE